MKKLYVYSSDTWLEKGYIKVGQSIDVQSRKSAAQTHSPEELKLIETFNLPGDLQDHDIHKELERSGFERTAITKNGGKEWFEADINDVRRAFNNLTIKEARAHSYDLRSEQASAVKKALLWYNNSQSTISYKTASHKNRFLLNAKMRFGKCFTSISIAKELNSKNTLIITYKPEVLSEWIETVSDHLKFKNWYLIRALKKNNTKELSLEEDGSFPKVNGPQVTCVSLQDLEISSSGKTKKRLSKLIQKKWDLVIFDEVHFGSLTGRALDIINTLKYSKRLDLSGTPFKLLESEDLCKEQIFTYSYLDEQENKNKEIRSKSNDYIYRIFPTLDISTIEITKEDLQEQLDEYRNEDLELSLNKIFEASSSKFKHPHAVDNFIDGLVLKNKKARSISVYGSLSTTLELPTKRNSVWWVNSVSTAKAFVKKLKEHPYFKNFEIINAAGTGKSTVEDDDEKANEIIAKEKHQVISKIKKSQRDDKSFGTITLTVRRFLTGVTIKEWDSILILNDSESPEEYYQAIFRVQSPWVSNFGNQILKPKAWVFDFSITRCLRMKIGLANAIATESIKNKPAAKTKDELGNTANDLCSSFSLKSFVDGQLYPNPMTASDIFAAINLGAARSSLARRITSDAIINLIPLKLIEKDKQLAKILDSIKGYRTQEIGSIKNLVQIGKIEDDIDRGKKTRKDATPKGKLSKKQKEIKRQRKLIATQIKRLAIAMADFIYMTEEREFSIEEVLETKEAIFFKTVTGISKTDFKKLCDLRFIKKEKLNEIVRDFYLHEETSLNPDEFILSSLNEAA